MTDKEKIRAEIERHKEHIRIGLNAYDAGYENGRFELCNDLLFFIDSLPEEPTIDAEIVKDIHNLLHVKSGPLPMPSKVKFGDKVRIIILPNE